MLRPLPSRFKFTKSETTNDYTIYIYIDIDIVIIIIIYDMNMNKYIDLKSHNKRQEVDNLPAGTWANRCKRLLLLLDVIRHDSNGSTSAVFAKFGLALQLSELQGTLWPFWQGQ